MKLLISICFLFLFFNTASAVNPIDFFGITPARSNTAGNVTRYYNSDGTYAGNSKTDGKTTRYYYPNGSYAGRSVESGNSTHYYNAAGNNVGRSQKSGNTDPIAILTQP
jgi:hypothetical protein